MLIVNRLIVAGLTCIMADTESFLVGHKYEVSVYSLLRIRLETYFISVFS